MKPVMLAGATFGLFWLMRPAHAASVPHRECHKRIRWGRDVHERPLGRISGQGDVRAGSALFDTALTVTVDAQHLTVAAGTVTD